MQPLPHQYQATTYGTARGNFATTLRNDCTLEVAAPLNFDGPGNTWTPEEMLLGAVANCLALTFRSIARAAGLDWLEIQCTSEGVLDKVDKRVLFTRISTLAQLTVAAGEDREKAEKLLRKAEENCFVSNSLSSEKQFTADVQVSQA
ncbi:OsmC family protein [Porticoccus hydrocarbonoclasticus]|jgi:peroxiredoxin-like protein|uniref:OsmC family protein n=1 Tax=Porticoccus hydrocarbonoclasticus TaxID=1073414 RepID=UPI00055C05D2|nr:OsmC family protein [Porticoccus hydrocarbonoclasticus]|tara:strand:+ start:2760 stop:3200 length:441 start_codon:yes stop_codon:yes gene_type:complete